ncbi:LacI family transcriptional regulator [Periweissella cryptocerci]|uniref:LacI family transcriptional regulator n=1 Tax=Periweissella cryptocerci TaxID=2506420 RepID=A0A4P6YUZ3_9LACO|nr:LacI family DNA-binding transcriptional regulator [Periweissella cryptocerci]QBO36556.1 LacI family transcriptional regulator [Periweissella cryptocerci]
MPKKVTIREVAQLSEVSITAVSQILNGKGERFPLATREKVIAAKDELGYVPNYSAQTMRNSGTITMGVLVPDIHNPFFSRFFQGVQDYGKYHNLRIILVSSDGDHERDVKNVDELIGRSADGLIIANDVAEDMRIDKMLTKNNIPYLLLDQSPDDGYSDHIEINEYHGGQLAAQHLLDLGHQKIAIASPAVLTPNLSKRVQGFVDTLAAADVDIADRICITELNKHSGYATGSEIIKKFPDTTAIWGLNDEVAIGIYKAIADAGKKIPADISVIGYDNTDYADYLQPPLTTIDQPIRESGQRAAEMLHARINNPKVAKQVWRHDVELVVRESTRKL